MKTTNNTFRKTSKGEWVVMGEAKDLRPGASVAVAKRDGTTTTVTIASLGQPFVKGNVRWVYGYPTKTATRTRARARTRTGHDCPECNGPCRGGCVAA